MLFFLSIFVGFNADVITFRASELQNVSQKWAGSDKNWKIVTSLASFNAENNTFSLSDNAQQVLKEFSLAYKSQLSLHKKYADEIARGAKVFVPQRLATCDSLFTLFSIETAEGRAVKAISIVPALERAVNILASENAVKRIKKVEARLAEKSGDVDRRKGLMGTWINALLNDLFVEEDGIRTAPASMARLSFIDGSDVIIEPSSVAIIRQSRVDQLSSSSETEITINNGAMLARLSSEMQQKSTFQVRASGSLTTVKSSKFYAERKLEDDEVTLSNYNGTANVQANAKQVQLGENEGTIVARGKDPLPPVKLLPAPKLNWENTDSVIYDDAITIAWTPVVGSTKYQIDISEASGFEHSVRSVSSTNPTAKIASIALGVNYLRVRAYDKLGLRGIDSPTYRVLRNKDVMPPPVIVDNDPGITFYLTEPVLTFTGHSEPFVQLFVNNKTFSADLAGKFSIKLPVAEKAGNVLVKAVDRSGNATTLNRTYVVMQPQKLANLIWSVPLENGQIPRTTMLSVSGLAYPVLQVKLSAGKTAVVAECGTEGQWAASFAVPADAGKLEIVFVDKRTGAEISRIVYPIL